MAKPKMTRAEMVELIAGTLSMKPAQVEDVLSKFARIAALRMEEGIAVPLPGLGALVPTERAARTGRNPRPGEDLAIPARIGVRFKPGKTLTDRLKARSPGIDADA